MQSDLISAFLQSLQSFSIYPWIKPQFLQMAHEPAQPDAHWALQSDLTTLPFSWNAPCRWNCRLGHASDRQPLKWTQGLLLLYACTCAILFPDGELDPETRFKWTEYGKRDGMSLPRSSCKTTSSMERLSWQKLIISSQQSVRSLGKTTLDSQPRDTDIINAFCFELVCSSGWPINLQTFLFLSYCTRFSWLLDCSSHSSQCPVPTCSPNSNLFSGRRWDDTSSRKPSLISLIIALITPDSKQHEGSHQGSHDSLWIPCSYKRTGHRRWVQYFLNEWRPETGLPAPHGAEVSPVPIACRHWLHPEFVEAMLLICTVIILNSNLIFPPSSNISPFILSQ